MEERVMNGWYDITDFGARGDGATPAEGAINQALAAASRAGGGVVWFPPGRYLLGAKVVVDRQVTLLGAGWASRDPAQGSWITVSTPGVNLEIRAEGTRVEALGFFQDQPSRDTVSWQPANHEFAIHAGADDIFLKQINLFNCTHGIRVRHHAGGTIGRVTLDHIWGQPLRTGIEIDNAWDVVKVNNVHFWPFWDGNPDVRDWMMQNGTGISVFRADNPQFSNIFVLGYNRGIAFGESGSGIASKFAIVNADCDYCETGIQVGGTNATGMITNYSSQGAPGNVGLAIVSDGIKLLATNLRITMYRGNAVRAAGGNTRVFLHNLWAESWNRANSAFPGVEATDGAVIYLGRPLFFDRGNGGPNWRRDGINGGRVLTEFNELVSEQ
jgi:hypothetical protein